jgi:hypothetical protein
MSTLQIYDPALCCSSGVCGPEVDARLLQASADIDWARGAGAHIERFNLASQPLAFAQQAEVKAFLERAGQDALPLTLLDGQVMLAGRYPSRQQLAQWLGLPAVAPENSCCSGGSCCA